MRSYLTGIVLLWCFSPLFAGDTTGYTRRPALEIQFGGLAGPALWNGQPYLGQTVGGYYFKTGWEMGLEFAVPLGKRLSFSTRWKQSFCFSPEDDISGLFHQEYPDLIIWAGGGIWRLNQLNTGVIFELQGKRMSMEFGQFAGLTLLNIPFLQITGRRPYQQYAEMLIFRKAQKQNMYSLYTRLGAKYRLSERRYAVLRGEFAFHRIKEQRIGVETAFGPFKYYHGSESDYFLTCSIQVGIGWRLGGG